MHSVLIMATAGARFLAAHAAVFLRVVEVTPVEHRVGFHGRAVLAPARRRVCVAPLVAHLIGPAGCVGAAGRVGGAERARVGGLGAAAVCI